MSCLDKVVKTVKSGPDDSVSYFYINMTCYLRSRLCIWHDLHLIFDMLQANRRESSID